MKEIVDWAARITRILAWIAANRVPYAEITLTVKGGKVTFVDYKGPLINEEPGSRNEDLSGIDTFR